MYLFQSIEFNKALLYILNVTMLKYLFGICEILGKEIHPWMLNESNLKGTSGYVIFSSHGSTIVVGQASVQQASLNGKNYCQRLFLPCLECLKQQSRNLMAIQFIDSSKGC